MSFFRNKLAVAISLLSVGFLALIGYSIGRNNKSIFESGISGALNPVQKVIYKTSESASEFTHFVFSFTEVKKENNELIARNTELEKEVLDYNQLKAENESLHKQLDFKSINEYYKFITCNIINKSGGGFLDELTIDKGSDEGIAKGMVAVSPEGLVGQVISVSKGSSIIQTLGNENIGVTALVANNPDNEGIVKGYKDSNNNLMAKISSLKTEADIKKDDVVTTSGNGAIYPKGIRIGTITDVVTDNVKVMKTAVIKPFVDFNKLSSLFVIVPSDKINMKYQGDDIKY